MEALRKQAIAERAPEDLLKLSDNDLLAALGLVKNRHPRIGTNFPSQLIFPHVHRINLRRSTLKQKRESDIAVLI